MELTEIEPPFTAAVVDFGGIQREVSMACVPEAGIGDYVMVHAGIAISLVDAEEAARILDILRELDLDDEAQADEPTVIERGTP
jgi:hydrogenase expression/formation protein HypC